MKITKSYLKQVIKEEIKRTLIKEALQDTPIVVSGKRVDPESIEFDYNDPQHRSEAYVKAAQFMDGQELKPEELEFIERKYRDVINPRVRR